MTCRLSVWVVVAALLGAWQSQPPSRPPQFRSGVSLVYVDAAALDEGRHPFTVSPQPTSAFVKTASTVPLPRSPK